VLKGDDLLFSERNSSPLKSWQAVHYRHGSSSSARRALLCPQAAW
jgi:hypothetical protein